MRKSLQLSALLLAGLVGSSYGQNPPVFSQYFANPYQFNPSYAGSNGYSEANLFYRRQWLGIDNTPTVGGINFQAPIGRNVSVGLLGYSDKSALLTNTSVLATFGYRIRFKYGHHLNFGISGGVGFNNFDLSALESTSDPALAGITETNTYLNGQVGFNYQWNNLNIGFAFPKLFDSKPNSVESFNEVKFDKLDYRFGSASYTIPLGNTTITPSVVYRSIDAAQDQLEGMLIANYKNIFWIGGSYRDEYGITGFVGINVKGLLRIGYAYEKATGDIADVVDGTHEVYLGARLSKGNRELQWASEKQERDSLRFAENQNAKAEPVVAKEIEPSVSEEAVAPRDVTVQEEEAVELALAETVVEPSSDEQTETIRDPSPGQVIPDATTPETEQPEAEPESASKVSEPLSPGFYVVVGVYKIRENAIREVGNLRTLGISGSILYNPEKDYYYVYTFKSSDKNASVRELYILKRQNRFFGAWLFSVM